MSFIEGFYSFKISLNDTYRGVYQELRLKLARHPMESLDFLYARLFAYLDSYEEDLKFSEGLFQPKQPTIWKKDLVGDVVTWIEVGSPSRDKMMRALKHDTTKTFKIYFTSNEEIETFCHHLRGSTTNWAGKVNFYLINQNFLEQLTPLARSSSTISATFVDNTLYLIFDEVEFETVISQVDIWERYQASIQNIATPS